MRYNSAHAEGGAGQPDGDDISARRRNLKRGGVVQHFSLDKTGIVDRDQDTDLRVVEMRFFGELNVAKAWL